MIGPDTDWALFESDDYERDADADDAQDSPDDYGADDDWPADICHNLYDGQ